ncbi:hypothetical protein PSP6_270204 [Paraburkholderia tropica]|nr:hypothetical protein PSP6_270204 [Paraburkholderia tropica]
MRRDASQKSNAWPRSYVRLFSVRNRLFWDSATLSAPQANEGSPGHCEAVTKVRLLFCAAAHAAPDQPLPPSESHDSAMIRRRIQRPLQFSLSRDITQAYRLNVNSSPAWRPAATGKNNS